MTTYAQKLKDPRWQKKRLEIMSRDQWKCTICFSSERTLHVHHLSYSGDPWEAESDQMTTYCEDCHALVESYKNGGLTVLQTAKRTLNDDIYFLEIYNIDKQHEYSVCISLYEYGRAVYHARIMESGLKRHIKRINKLKKQTH